jgi:hypothetical protein
MLVTVGVGLLNWAGDTEAVPATPVMDTTNEIVAPAATSIPTVHVSEVAVTHVGVVQTDAV